MKEGDRSQLIQQIESIENKLRKGTFIVKEGHKMKDVSDGSETKILPLSWGQIQQRKLELDNLNRVLTYGVSRRKIYHRKK